MKKLIAIASAALLVAGATPASTRKSRADNDIILHAFTWSFDTIAANMKQIADAGFTYVQTSPANTCFVGEDGGMALFSQEGDSVKGKWYYHYQPIDWQIGNYQLGTRDGFRALADSADRYGVKIIVDVLPNHTAFDRTAVLPALNNAAGGHENLYHANGFNNITEWNDRLQCTTGAMGGLPDVNTENPGFQHYFLQYINDLINLGARGFRYDTAKHIGLPSDPLDPRSKQNDFWDIATGRKGVRGLSLLMPDSLFIYGEVLQDKNVKEKEYEEYIDQTASAYGHELRQALENGKADIAALSDWHHPADPSHLVTWVESHDTYANAHESAHLTDDMVRQGWVWLTAREKGTPLFFSRPAGRTPEKYWGNNRIGARGNDEFFHPEVVAANKFRRSMAGQPEQIGTLDDGTVLSVARGCKGLALINISQKPQKIKMETALPDGTYTDSVHGLTFKVKKGVLTGKLTPTSSALIF